jgi:glycosyltransferase involved in cell wall biosynthesis
MVEVSVLIPNYNHAEYLGQRIESVLNQTHQDFEVIILDDCSTDHSREVIERYAMDPRVSHVIFNDINSGSTFLQWEKGINLAKGKYVWIAESDDWCEPSLLSDLVDGIKKDDQCVISYCQISCVDVDNRIKWQSHHKYLSEIVDSKTFVEDYLAIKVSIFNASMAIFERAKYLNLTNEFTKFKFCGDWFFWIQIARQGKVHISGKVLNYFRKHDKDVSGKAYKSGQNLIEEIKVTNWMFTEKVINHSVYKKAFKKQFKAYWKVKNTIDPSNREVVKQMLKHPLSPSINTFTFLPSAIWNAYRK